MARHGQVAKQGISIHAPRTGSDSTTLQKIKTPLTFQSTLPARGATTAQRANHCRFSISIHAPRTGSDTSTGKRSTISLNFNPRSPHGERRYLRAHGGCARNFNPRSPHGERRVFRGVLCVSKKISIHAPRWGSDPFLQGAFCTHHYFNPRAPHGERRFRALVHHTSVIQFQSTLPARGATCCRCPVLRTDTISIHAPRTGSDNWLGSNFFDVTISIHAPRTGSDADDKKVLQKHLDFNPRSPHGERPRHSSPRPSRSHFNPRSPHGERPHRRQLRHARRSDFNPRSPHGERL